MKKIVLMLMVFVSVFVKAQTASQWENVYGSGGNETGYRVRTCLGQGYIVAGSTSSSGITDGYVVRVDSLGLVMWSKYYIGSNVDIFTSIKQLPDSGYILSGYSNSGGNGGYDGWVYRIDKNGDSLWSKYIGTSDWDFFYDVAPTSDSGFILAGGTYGAGQGDEDMYFVKLNSNGNILWEKTYGGIKPDEAKAVIETGDTMLAAVGYSYSLGDSLGDSWILRMNSNGDTTWTATLNSPTVADKAFGIADCNQYGRLYIVGQTTIPGNGDDAYIHCITYSAGQVFTLTNGATAHDDYKGIVVRPDGSLGVVGTTFSYGLNGNMYFFKDYISWVYRTFGTNYEDGGYSIDFTTNYGYIACGYTYGYTPTHDHTSMYLVKIDSTGFSSGILNIREFNNPESEMSSSVFPNPSQDEATFTYDTKSAIRGKLHLSVYDISGRIVLTVPESEWEINSQKFATCRVRVDGLVVGMYNYVVTDDAGEKTAGKLIVSH
jgi:hypothetical protein